MFGGYKLVYKMKKFVLLFLFFLFFIISFVSSVDIDDCGDNPRCKFRIAAEQNDLDACESIDGVLANHCKKFVADKTDVLDAKAFDSDKIVSDFKLSEYSKEIVIIVSILVFFAMLFLSFEHYRHESFIKDNPKLLGYIKSSLSKNVSEDEIKKNLRKVGWKEDIIEEAIRDAKK
jgi:hypothetical protein|tara:strand:- start:966 stop:1490 length:525 start_codon:yes stop_codon:yes gene_type:complete